MAAGSSTGLITVSVLDIRGDADKLLGAVLLTLNEESTTAELLICSAGECLLVTSSATLITSWSMILGGRESGGSSSTGVFVFADDGGAERLGLFLVGTLVEATLIAFTEGLRQRNDRFGGILCLQKKFTKRAKSEDKNILGKTLLCDQSWVAIKIEAREACETISRRNSPLKCQTKNKYKDTTNR